jgi:putative DNA primase/helicase
MNLRDRHLHDLKGSDLSDEMIELSNCWSADRAEVMKILGFDAGSAGLAFPYPGTNGDGPPFIRIKPDVPFKDSDGREAKYLTRKDAGSRLYIPPIHSEKDFRNLNKPVIITEGEKKALKGAQELPGFLVIGLAGVWCFKTKKLALIDDFRKISWKNRDVYIVYDSDVVRKPEVQEAENALATQLDKLGANVHVCRFPDGAGR